VAPPIYCWVALWPCLDRSTTLLALSTVGLTLLVNCCAGNFSSWSVTGWPMHFSWLAVSYTTCRVFPWQATPLPSLPAFTRPLVVGGCNSRYLSAPHNTPLIGFSLAPTTSCQLLHPLLPGATPLPWLQYARPPPAPLPLQFESQPDPLQLQRPSIITQPYVLGCSSTLHSPIHSSLSRFLLCSDP
jgi:hypothetical protein